MMALVTGATGYIGGRLVPRLLAEGHQVRAMTRSAGRLRDVPWASQVEVVEADALDPSSLVDAMAGVEVAYYLIHSIDTGEFEESDAVLAAGGRSPDVALVPVGGWGHTLGPHHLDPQQAADLVARVRPGTSIPVHWGTLHPVALGATMGDRFVEPGRRFVAEAAEIHDLFDTRVGGRISETPGRLDVAPFPIARTADRVHQVVRGVHALQCRAQAVLVGDVAVGRLALALIGVGMAGHRPDLMTLFDQGGNQS